MQGAQASVISNPKHGKLLPVKENEERGFFYLADKGYIGRDKVKFLVEFGTGQKVVLNNRISVVSVPQENRMSLEDDRFSLPCTTTAAEYRKMRRDIQSQQQNGATFKRWSPLSGELFRYADSVRGSIGCW